MHKLKVCELFAGVGGFRLGLEPTNGFEVVWSNQWEPSTKTQHASKVYESRFGAEGHSNEDIAQVPTKAIPDHDVLVGGFPCQDYSVATTLKNSKGLIGKKGVLWWSIHRILQQKKNKPQYLIFENVDRLLKSPLKQRGRDFAIMLSSLSQLGYAVEWRVINAAEYGMPQRRRRLFFVGVHNSTKLFQKMKNNAADTIISETGIMAEAFPVSSPENTTEVFSLEKDLVWLSENFNAAGALSPFQNSGLCIGNKITTTKVTPSYDGPKKSLADVLEKDPVDSTFYLQDEALEKWEYLKGSKKEIRTTKEGFEYRYTEGAMIFPDALNNASRTIITGEGGPSPSRFKHVVQTVNGLRRLTPVELERLNMFPDNHTQLSGITDTKRAFFMGNALVVGVVEKIGHSLLDQLRG